MSIWDVVVIGLGVVAVSASGVLAIVGLILIARDERVQSLFKARVEGQRPRRPEPAWVSWECQNDEHDLCDTARHILGHPREFNCKCPHHGTTR